MSLYYEPDPANDDDPPLLPPILTPIAVPEKVDVFTKAISAASKSDAGTVFYSENLEYVEIAVVLIPEVIKIKCNQILYVMMVKDNRYLKLTLGAFVKLVPMLVL